MKTIQKTAMQSNWSAFFHPIVYNYLYFAKSANKSDGFDYQTTGYSCI